VYKNYLQFIKHNVVQAKALERRKLK